MIEVYNRFKGEPWCNSYIVGDEGKDCFIVDFGYNEDNFIIDYALKHHPRILGILFTHAHIDHTYGLKDLKEQYPLFMAAEDQDGLSDPFYLESPMLGLGKLSFDDINAYPVEDEDEIKLGDYIIKVIATPFHTKGSVCYLLENEGILFSGDTLFYRGIGRFDLKASCPRFMESSLRKLFALDGNLVVYPGHGKKTKLADEKVYLGY